MISQELLNELKIIIKEDYGIDLAPEVVSDIGYTLVGFFETLAQVACETGINIPVPENSITDSKQIAKEVMKHDTEGC